MRFRGLAAAAIAVAMVWAAPAWATCPLTNFYTLRDGNFPQVLRQIFAFIMPSTCSILPANVPVNTDGVPLSGSLGADFSANQPTIPNVGSNFAGSGPYASYVLIKTIAANPDRLSVDIENTSGAQIVVIRDDGTAASSSAPVNATVFPLAGGASAGAQGGSWSSNTFKGRVQIYAPSSGAQVATMAE